MHLHYHKNGSLDDPVLVDPIIMPENANSGASQPTAAVIASSPSQPVVGRREGVLEFTILLKACWNNQAGPVVCNSPASVNNLPSKQPLQGRSREEEEQARMDMAIVQWRRLKAGADAVWF